MRVIAILLGLLFGVFLLLTAVGALSDRAEIAPDLRGRIALAVVMAFTASGHFFQTGPMSRMLPPRVPLRVPLIYGTGASSRSRSQRRSSCRDGAVRPESS